MVWTDDWPAGLAGGRGATARLEVTKGLRATSDAEAGSGAGGGPACCAATGWRPTEPEATQKAKMIIVLFKIIVITNIIVQIRSY